MQTRKILGIVVLAVGGTLFLDSFPHVMGTICLSLRGADAVFVYDLGAAILFTSLLLIEMGFLMMVPRKIPIGRENQQTISSP